MKIQNLIHVIIQYIQNFLSRIVKTRNPFYSTSYPQKTTKKVKSDFTDSEISSAKDKKILNNTIYFLPFSFMVLAAVFVVALSIKNSQDTRDRADNTSPTLSITPSKITGNVNETFSFGIVLNTGTDTVSAVILDLTYDPAAIEIVNVTSGNSNPLNVILVSETHTNGQIKVTLGSQPSSPFNGTAILQNVTAKIISAKESSITFTDMSQVASIGKEQNSLGSKIGAFINTTTTNSPSDTGIPTSTVTSTSAPLPTSTPLSQSGCKDQSPGGSVRLTSATPIGAHSIKLTWTEASNPVSYYLLSYGVESGQYIYGNPNVGGQGTTTYTVNGLATGKRYYFIVRAGNGCAPGSFSNELSAVAGSNITPISSSTPKPTRTPTSTQVPTQNIVQKTIPTMSSGGFGNNTSEISQIGLNPNFPDSPSSQEKQLTFFERLIELLLQIFQNVFGNKI